MNKTNYVFRTTLFVPGHNEKLIRKAAKTDADALVLDLEDSCRPEANKAVGRKVIKEIVQTGLLKKFFVFVRINPRETCFMFDDISALAIKEIDGFLYPMAKSKSDIVFFSTLLTEIEMSRGIERNHFKIFPVIETGGGILNAREICSGSERVVALGYGSEDFKTDMYIKPDEAGMCMFSPRAMIAFAARSQGVVPIDTPHIDVHDIDGLKKHCADARTLGFGGMQILHPKEIEYVHEFYTPTKEETEYAKEIIRLYEEAELKGVGVAIMNGKFISPPTVKRAYKIIETVNNIENFIKNREK